MTRSERDKIIHLINHGALHDIDTGKLDEKCEDVIPLEDGISIINTVYEEQKTGYYIPIYKGDKLIGWRCSECGLEITKPACICQTPFCRHCGTKMKIETNNPLKRNPQE